MNRECLPNVEIQLLKRLCFAGETSMSAACNIPKQTPTRKTISIAESLIANSLRTPSIASIDGGTGCADTGCQKDICPVFALRFKLPTSSAYLP